ncbi:MAG: hypothetical protein ACTSV5_13790 [Promethearchaeota archaeon]
MLMKLKRNLFARKVECWQCTKKIHLAVLTKYNGVLCKKCYHKKYETMKRLFIDFLASFEVEYDTDFKEDTETLHNVIEMIYDNYEECCYHLEDEEPKAEYRNVVNRARELYFEVKEFDTTSWEDNRQ